MLQIRSGIRKSMSIGCQTATAVMVSGSALRGSAVGHGRKCASRFTFRAAQVSAQTNRWTKARTALRRIAADSDQTEPRVPALNRADATHAHTQRATGVPMRCGGSERQPPTLTGSASAHLAAGSPPLHRSRALRRTRRAAGCGHDRPLVGALQWRSAPLRPAPRGCRLHWLRSNSPRGYGSAGWRSWRDWLRAHVCECVSVSESV